MTPRRRKSDSEDAIGQEKELWELKSLVIATAKSLEAHVTECAEINKDVAKNLRMLTISIGVLAGAVLGVDGLVELIGRFAA